MDYVPYVRGDAGNHIAGYIFMCNTRTKRDCYIYRVFGLPASRIGVVEKIKPDTKLFLFDFDLKLLYGLYAADSSGKMAIEPCAFEGKFPAQVKFSIARDCLPLPEVALKDAIRENYHSSYKFKQELSVEQVNKLLSLFRPITVSSPPRPSLVFHKAVDSLHSGYRGPSLQIAKLPTYGQYLAGSAVTDVQPHPGYSHVREFPFPSSRLDHSQVAPTRNDRLALQPSFSQPCQQFDTGHAHQVYHPDDPGLSHRNTHARYAYMSPGSSGTVARQVPSASSYYGLNHMPKPNLSPQQSQAVGLGPSSTLLSSSLTASQWVAMASQADTPGSQASSFTTLSSTEPHLSFNGSNCTVAPYGYQNSGYPSSYWEPPVITDQGSSNVSVHAFEPHPASASSYYGQSNGDPTLPQTISSGSAVGVDNPYVYNATNSTALASEYQYQGYPSSHQTLSSGSTVGVDNNGTNSIALASEYKYQGYYSSHQTPSITTDQLASNVPSHPYETNSTYLTTEPLALTGQQYPITQLTAPGVSADPISGYVHVPTYSLGANPTS